MLLGLKWREEGYVVECWSMIKIGRSSSKGGVCEGEVVRKIQGLSNQLHFASYLCSCFSSVNCSS